MRACSDPKEEERSELEILLQARLDEAYAAIVSVSEQISRLPEGPARDRLNARMNGYMDAVASIDSEIKDAERSRAYEGATPDDD